MNQLQKTLLVNALFSGISGIVLVTASQYLAHQFALTNDLIFRIIGIGLLIFTAFILFVIKRKNLIGVQIIIMLDVLWVLSSVVILMFQPFEISKLGNGMIALVALIVLFMGFNQANALARVDEKAKDRVKQLRFERTVKASTGEVWKVISDVANYHEVAPNIDDVKILSGQREGMVRSCSQGKDRWTETCSLWIEEQAYSFEVNTTAPDYPYPFKRLTGTWEVVKIDDTTTNIIMLFEFQYRRKSQNVLMHPLLKSNFSNIAEELLDNWQMKLDHISTPQNTPIF